MSARSRFNVSIGEGLLTAIVGLVSLAFIGLGIVTAVIGGLGSASAAFVCILLGAVFGMLPGVFFYGKMDSVNSVKTQTNIHCKESNDFIELTRNSLNVSSSKAKHIESSSAVPMHEIERRIGLNELRCRKVNPHDDNTNGEPLSNIAEGHRENATLLHTHSTLYSQAGRNPPTSRKSSWFNSANMCNLQ